MFSCKLVCVLSHKREPNKAVEVPHPDVWLKFLDNIVSAKGDDDTVSLLRELGTFNETLFKHILNFRLLFNEINTIYRWISSLDIDYSSNPNPNPIGLSATMFVWSHGHENTYTLLEVI
jgi:hypothetical protein